MSNRGLGDTVTNEERDALSLSVTNLETWGITKGKGESEARSNTRLQIQWRDRGPDGAVGHRHERFACLYACPSSLFVDMTRHSVRNPWYVLCVRLMMDST